MNDPFRANQDSLRERHARLESENGALRAEIARIRGSIEEQPTTPPLRVRGPFVLLAIALVLQMGWYARTFATIRQFQNSQPHCTL